MGVSIRILVMLLLVGYLSHLDAQDSQSPLSSDPEAAKVLDQTEKFLLAKQKLTASYKMVMNVPGDEPIELDGTLAQDGDKFRIEAGDYLILNNGESRWVYMKEGNEVNIYDADMQDSPATLIGYIQYFRGDEFIYRIADEYAGAGERAIECKPIDSSSDFIKVRLTVSSKTFEPVRIEIFEKGGLKTDMRVLKIEEASNFNEDHFVFNPDEYPGVKVEDLRID